MNSCNKKKSCEKCGWEVTVINYTKHFNACVKGKPDSVDKWMQPNGKCKCPECGKEYTRLGIKNHIWRMHTEDGRTHVNNMVINNVCAGWNKGLTKETSDAVKKYGETHSKRLKNGSMVHNWTGKKHTEETKLKISKHRIQYLKDNPDKVPYLLNHHSKGKSYPEKYFEEVFKNENVNVTPSYRISLYELDFAMVDDKIDIEIDGSQHYCDERIVESDKRRTKYLENLGWKVIRVNWKEYSKQSFIDRKKYVKNLVKQINNGCISQVGREANS